MSLIGPAVLLSGVGVIIGIASLRIAPPRKNMAPIVTRKSDDDLYERFAAAMKSEIVPSDLHRAYGGTAAAFSAPYGIAVHNESDFTRHIKDDEAARELGFYQSTPGGDDLPDAFVTYDPPSAQPEVTSTETCALCDVKNGQHATDCPQAIIDNIFNNRWGANWKHAVMPEQFVSRILTAAEIAELDEYPLLAAMASPPNMGGLGNPDYAGPHYNSTDGSESRFVPYEMLGEPMRGTAVHAIGSVACVGPVDFQGENHVSTHHLDPDRAHAD